MIALAVTVMVKADRLQEFLDITARHQKASSQEPGNLRFDVLQDPEDSCNFLLYEVYESEEALQDHKKTPHYSAWCDTVADWMAEPRRRKYYNQLFPNDRSCFK